MEKITQRNVIEKWAKQYPEVERWLSHLQQKNMNAFSLYRFCQWSKFTPTQLLDEKKKNPSANTVEKILDDFCNTDDKSFTNSFKYQGSIAVKSFFRWNYADLAKASGAITLQKVKPYNKLTKEGLRKLWNRTRNPRDRALVPFVLSTAIAKETLSNLTWGLLEENWESKELPALDIPSELLKGHGVGRYKGVRQITFLTPECKAQLINYKEWLEQRLGRKFRVEENIWRDLQAPYKALEYDSFSTLISRLTKEAGVPFTWHDGRRWLTTALEQIGISPNWNRVFRGRKVQGSENPYSRPAIEQLRAKFREAVPLLEFTSETSSGVEQRLKDLEKFKQSLTPEQQELVTRSGLRFQRKKKLAHEPESDCTDGEHCQKVVTEAELPALLATGWRASVVLPSGKIVVER